MRGRHPVREPLQSVQTNVSPGAACPSSSFADVLEGLTVLSRNYFLLFDV